MIAANDGGVDIIDQRRRDLVRPAAADRQFYHVSADTRTPYHVAGAMQDLGTAQGPSQSLQRQHRPVRTGTTSAAARPATSSPTPAIPNIVYAGEYLGIITRYDHRTGESRNVSAWPENPSGHGGEDMKYRFQWTAPIAPSPHDPKVIYHGAQVIFRTTNGGQSLGRRSAPISPATTSPSRSGPAGRSPATTPASKLTARSSPSPSRRSRRA